MRVKEMAKKKDSLEGGIKESLFGTAPVRIPADLARMLHWICEFESGGRQKPAELLGEILRGPLTLRFEPVRERAEAIEAIQAKMEAEMEKIKKKKS